ncbi:MAG TPA: universal stress protein [Dongiaceae bacterium]|jgi:nucleotide-binding universal stress UspA family protein
MKILCAIDGKDYSLRAARVACDLAKRLNAELTICMVNPLLPGRGPPIYLWPEEYVATVLADVSRKAAWSGVRARSGTWHALSVSDSIADHADQEDIDYIVIGASDRSGMSKVLNGSVSRELAQKANCPVLIVHRVRGERPTGGRRGLRVRDFLPDRLSAGVLPRHS